MYNFDLENFKNIIEGRKIHRMTTGKLLVEFDRPAEAHIKTEEDQPIVLVKDDTAVLIYNYLEEYQDELPDFEQIRDQFNDLYESISITSENSK